MTRFAAKFLALTALVLGCTALIAADDKTPVASDKPAISDKIDWGAFVDYSKVVGEVEKVDNGVSFSLKVNELVPQVSGGNSYSRRTQPRVTTKAKTEKFSLLFHDEGLVRWEKAPPKFDDKGKKVPRTEKEFLALKKPIGAPGYAADKSDLHVGQIVEVTLMRPKAITAEKAVPSDLRVKYVVVSGTQTAPTDAKKDDAKKDAKKDDK